MGGVGGVRVSLSVGVAVKVTLNVTAGDEVGVRVSVGRGVPVGVSGWFVKVDVGISVCTVVEVGEGDTT